MLATHYGRKFQIIAFHIIKILSRKYEGYLYLSFKKNELQRIQNKCLHFQIWPINFYAKNWDLTHEINKKYI